MFVIEKKTRTRAAPSSVESSVVWVSMALVVASHDQEGDPRGEMNVELRAELCAG